MADRYWNARGGSHNDGGAFIFNLQKDAAGKMRITCTDKFGKPVRMPGADRAVRFFQGILVVLRIRGIHPDRHQRGFVPGERRGDFRE